MVSPPSFSEEGWESGHFEVFHILPAGTVTYRLQGRDGKTVKSDKFTSLVAGVEDVI